MQLNHTDAMFSGWGKNWSKYGCPRRLPHDTNLDPPFIPSCVLALLNECGLTPTQVDDLPGYVYSP